VVEEDTSIAQASLVAEELEPAARMQLLEVLEEPPPGRSVTATCRQPSNGANIMNRLTVPFRSYS
jgi:hypothetical protein